MLSCSSSAPSGVYTLATEAESSIETAFTNGSCSSRSRAAAVSLMVLLYLKVLSKDQQHLKTKRQ